MSGSNRGIIAALIGIAILIAVGVLAWALYPPQPEITGEIGYQEQGEGYRPGGSDCEPTQIERLTGGERTKRTIECDEAAEQRRLESNDLIQQRRSADAADAMAISTYQQTRIGAWGLLLGGITMAAAIYAAWYARSAAVHSERAALGFVEAERAVVHVQSGDVGQMTISGEPAVGFEFLNKGRSNARIVRFGTRGSSPEAAPRWDVIRSDRTVKIAGFAPPKSKETIFELDCWIDYVTLGKYTFRSNFHVTVKWIEPDGDMWMLPRWDVAVTNTDGHPDDT